MKTGIESGVLNAISRPALTLVNSRCQINVCHRVKVSVELKREAGVCIRVLGELAGEHGTK